MKCKLIYSERKQEYLRRAVGQKKGITSEHRESLGGDGHAHFIMLAMMVSQGIIYVKTDQVVHFKYGSF